VEDTGTGMDARTRERAFDDFFTTKARGTGLGLAFVRRVVEAHGGAVALESEPGRGTVVRVRLPAG
jgi:signal transduction histidine kinase